MFLNFSCLKTKELVLVCLFFFVFFKQLTASNPEESCGYQKFGSEYLVNKYITNEQSYPAVSSVGSNGEKYVIAWQSLQSGESGDKYGIYAQVYNSSEGSKIGEEFQVNTQTTDDQKLPSVASVGSNGEKYVIAWQSGAIGDTDIYAQMYKSSDGSKIEEEFRANTYTDDEQSYPTVSSIGSNGEKYVIAWQSQQNTSSDEWGVYAQMYQSSDGSKIGEEFHVNTHTDDDQKLPSVTSIGSNGEKYVIAWQSEQSGESGDTDIYAQLYQSSDGTKIGGEFQVNTHTASYQSYPSVSSVGADKENFVVAWSSSNQDGNNWGVFAQLFSSSDDHLPIGEEVQINKYNISSQSYPKVASIGEDEEHFVVTWASYGQDSSNWGVFARIYSSTDFSPVGNEFQANTHTAADQTYPAVASFGGSSDDEKNQFVVTWMSEGQDNDAWGVFAQNYRFNHIKPSINKLIPEDHYFENSFTFDYQFDQDTFVDEQDGTDLKYEAKLANNDPLPSGLNFDSTNRQFSGSVSNQDSCKDYTIKVIAINSCNLTNSQNFQLLSTNTKPEANNTVPNRELGYGKDDYSNDDFKIPEYSFFDEQQEETALNYESELVTDNENNGQLPDWLLFDENTRTFSINANYQWTRDDMGDYQIKVLASDYCNESSSQIFDFQITNNPPYVNKPIDNLEMQFDEIKEFLFDQNTFLDPNNDDLNYELSLNDQDELPDWITFEESERKITINPENENRVGKYTLKLTASDELLSVVEEFTLNVNSDGSSTSASSTLYSLQYFYLFVSIFAFSFLF
ncbi:hypothetical protein M0813_22626 [Anaeramoeba flamelloides]|uniref:Dystroglycan-type cadherin-like domain-containing protein n=1 Tax=Anaeramoeba flamelloides TaxID=1746091 RepID=A0ABQ8YD66_9EUKA|nr:hypothetical protein M0813_22626 [Anaeramoeba flamelloides]